MDNCFQDPFSIIWWVSGRWMVSNVGNVGHFSHVFMFPSRCFKCCNCAMQFLHFSRDRWICRWLFLTCYFGFCCTVLQENNKTKHPQLLYEAKLYHILQGGSMLLDVQNAFAYTWLAFYAYTCYVNNLLLHCLYSISLYLDINFHIKFIYCLLET